MTIEIHEKAAIGFDRASDAYESGRPDYPVEAIDFLVKQFDIKPSSQMVDLAAGTGKFTKYLFPFNNHVIAIEPVERMRQKFSSLYPAMQVLNGSAEYIPVVTESIDVVTVAQGFHWFNGEKALSEIRRVLKPKGKLGLIWNVRDESVSWVRELSQIIDPYEGSTPRYTSMIWKEAFDDTPYFSPLRHSVFTYTHISTIETILDRVNSISFISALPEQDKKYVATQVKKLIENHPSTRNLAQIPFPYLTHIYCTEKLLS